MYRVNVVNSSATSSTSPASTTRSTGVPTAQSTVAINHIIESIASGASKNLSVNSSLINGDDMMITSVKVEPLHETTTASTSNQSQANGHVVYGGNSTGASSGGKRQRIDTGGGPEDWLPSPRPPLSPSPGSQSHTYTTTMSNGYSSPMSTGSYDPYSPNGKIGKFYLFICKIYIFISICLE